MELERQGPFCDASSRDLLFLKTPNKRALCLSSPFSIQVMAPNTFTKLTYTLCDSRLCSQATMPLLDPQRCG